MTTTWHLERFAYLPGGTLGELRIEGLPKIWTVERPWEGNRKGESCIPEGEYGLKPHTGNVQPAILIAGVRDRFAILFHIANKASELRGCIAPGMHYMVSLSPSVLNSRDAMTKLMEQFTKQGNQGALTITSKRALL